MKFTLTIETDLEGVTADNVQEVVGYSTGFQHGMKLDANDFYSAMNDKNTRILSCDEVKQDRDCQHEDYFKGH